MASPHMAFAAMPPIFRRSLIALLVLLVAIPFQPALAASSLEKNSRSGHSTNTKQAKTRGTPASLGPAIVHNFRVATDEQKTRLVLDLDRQTKPIERRKGNPARVVIALPNASMSGAVRAKATDGSLPSPFILRQTAGPAVILSLPTPPFRSYKQFSLSDPPRLVVDVTPPIELDVPSASNDPAANSIPTPPITQPTPPPTKGYTTIVIDPGHGGKDSGARGARKTEEKDIALKVGLKLHDLLKKQPGLRVLMTRDRDVFVELEDRTKFANNMGADLFVSIHVNSHPSRAVKGLEIYHFGEAKDERALEVAARENGTPLNNTGVGWEYLVADLLTTKKIEASLELAWTTKEAMVGHMNSRYDINDHGVKTAPFYVLRFTSMPSILAEIAYISNPVEEKLLRKPAFIRDVAQSLFRGVTSFLANNKM